MRDQASQAFTHKLRRRLALRPSHRGDYGCSRGRRVAASGHAEEIDGIQLEQLAASRQPVHRFCSDPDIEILRSS